MEPTFFGDPPLFGIYHSPDPSVPMRDIGVLVCPPVGHEHTRTHRALRVLGESLARAGFHALRFDYRGLGDSWGDSREGSVEGWCEDIDRALCELHALSGAREIAVVGLRLGATLAVRALGLRVQGRVRVRRLVMWDPVMSGAEFLDVSRKLQSALFADPGRFPKGRSTFARDADDDGIEYLLGYAYPSAQISSLKRIDLSNCDPFPDVATSLVLSRTCSRYDAFAAERRAAGRLAGLAVVSGPGSSWDDLSSYDEVFRAGLAIRAVISELDGIRA